MSVSERRAGFLSESAPSKMTGHPGYSSASEHDLPLSFPREKSCSSSDLGEMRQVSFVSSFTAREPGVFSLLWDGSKSERVKILF